VSGAPKIKAIEIVGGLEQEKRGVYAGAVGRFDFNSNELDTCIAIRTMTFKDGVAYLQSGKFHNGWMKWGYSLELQRFGIAGGGIVFDSVEEDEYMETINKLGANVRCIDAAEGELTVCGRLQLTDCR
jgi:anthranilate synthase component 1